MTETQAKRLATDSDPSVAEVALLWRHEQGGPTQKPIHPVRFVVEHPDASDEVITTAAETLLGVRVRVRPLFESDPDLDRFRSVVIDGVTRPDRSDLFEVAASLRTALRARTVEPDLGTNYFECECDIPQPGTPESADWAFWCWADPIANKPSDSHWATAKTLVREAWRASTEAGKPKQGFGVVIFQPDTGVVEHHACLPPRIHLDPRAVNFVEEGERPVDPLTSSGNPGHGTGTASVVASPDGSSMTGAAPLVTLVPIRCIESVTVFDQSPVARAIDHARRNGAHVITMSLGGVASSALHAAVKKAIHDNVIVLAAAGNCVGEVVWPARYSEVIAVGGINEALAPWRGSCRGPAVDVCGPAEFVARANPRDPVDPGAAVDGGQGTSFAVALTAGVAGLWLAHHGRERLIQLLPAGRNLTDMFNNILRARAQVPAGFDTDSFGAGIVDAASVLQFDPAHAFDPQVDRRPTEEVPADGLRSLVMSAFGGGGVEAAGDLLSDPQYGAELACAALDRIRAGRSLRAHVESLPPIQLSPTLRRRLGSKFPLTLTR